MFPRPQSAYISRSPRRTNSSFTPTRHPSLKGLLGGTAIRAGAFLALFAIIGTVFYAGTSSAASPSSTGATESSQSAARRTESNSNFGAWLLPAMMFQP
ncbi:MAG TPA: hypothetical protein VF634_11660, partial [Pyrinomonadaceae bacterium]